MDAALRPADSQPTQTSTARGHVTPIRAAASAADRETVTVGTYNINYRNRDLGSVAETIRGAQADLVFLQETNQDSERCLRRELSADYSFMSFRGGGPENPAGGFGLFAKFRVANQRWIKAEHGFFDTWLGEIAFGGHTVQIVNMHLFPIRLKEGGGFRDLLQSIQQSEQVRQQEVRRIYDHVRKDMPTIAAGDFNTTSASAAYAFLATRGFVDSFASVMETPDAYRTWHWSPGGPELSLRIDYIFHTKELRTLESRVVESDGSDHFLLVSKLTWNAEETEEQ